jgi:hypothetical protein
MKQIGFIGAFDKKDLLINIGLVLTNLGKRVLVIDATTTQRNRYLVPNTSSNGSPTYISDFKGVDVAVGFMNYMGIMQYLGRQDLPYDFIFVDTDNIQTFNSFGVYQMPNIFAVSSYDSYDINKLIELFRYIQTPIKATKVIISPDLSSGKGDLMNQGASGTNVSFTDNQVEFMDVTEDRRIIIENQLSNQLMFKRFSSMYKYSLEYITAIIADKIVNQSDIKAMIKRM